MCNNLADNVDHNILTLDGHNTFHGMGMIAASRTSRIPCVSVTAEDIAAIGKVNIEHFISESDGGQSLQYKKLEQYDIDDLTSNVEVLWRIFMLLRFPGPACHGMMQLIHKGEHPSASSVMFLRIIDLNPSNMNCVYSTRCNISTHASATTLPQLLHLINLCGSRQLLSNQTSVSHDNGIRSIVVSRADESYPDSPLLVPTISAYTCWNRHATKDACKSTSLYPDSLLFVPAGFLPRVSSQRLN